MNDAQKAARKTLARVLPETTIEHYNRQYGLSLEPGATAMDALKARLRKDARSGLKEAKELLWP